MRFHVFRSALGARGLLINAENTKNAGREAEKARKKIEEQYFHLKSDREIVLNAHEESLASKENTLS